MITAISIENFKGIRERVDIELRPLTLMFGANSAGKSTVLHALHYAREIFLRHNLDPDRTESGGKYVDLGGFKNFVHDHDLTQPIKIGLTIDVSETGLPVLTQPSLLVTVEAGSLISEVNRVRAEVTIRWSSQHEQAFVTEYRVELDGEWITAIEFQPGRSSCDLLINARNGSIYPSELFDPKAVDPAPESALYDLLTETDTRGIFSNFEWIQEVDDIGRIELDTTVALPGWERPLDLALLWPQTDDSDEAEWTEHLRENTEITLSQLTVGPGNLLCEYLRAFRYLGPLRETPPRFFRPPLTADDSRWSSGLGAWDALQNGPESLVRSVSDWLGDEDKLNAGYRIERREYFEVDRADPIVAQVLSGRAFEDLDSDQAMLDINKFPLRQQLKVVDIKKDLDLDAHDVGTGISQVVPVVVTALVDHDRLLAIEQPELHLHPKLQAELGDLFIEAALGERKQQLILETHSEHLILRLLRRIRETTSDDLPENKSALTPGDVTINYIEQTEEGARVTTLAIDESGEFIDRWPQGFFAERAEELF